jgi:hypothetical protein
VKQFNYAALCAHFVKAMVYQATLLNPVNREATRPPFMPIFGTDEYTEAIGFLRKQVDMETAERRAFAAPSEVSDEALSTDGFGPLEDAIEEERDEVSSYLAKYFGRVGGEPAQLDLQDWWTNHVSEFPVLSAVAFHVLSVHATSAGIERQFSGAKLIMTDHRVGAMKAKTAGRSVYLRQNLDELVKLCEQRKAARRNAAMQEQLVGVRRDAVVRTTASLVGECAP